MVRPLLLRLWLWLWLVLVLVAVPVVGAAMLGPPARAPTGGSQGSAPCGRAGLRRCTATHLRDKAVEAPWTRPCGHQSCVPNGTTFHAETMPRHWSTWPTYFCGIRPKWLCVFVSWVQTKTTYSAQFAIRCARHRLGIKFQSCPVLRGSPRMTGGVFLFWVGGEVLCTNLPQSPSGASRMPLPWAVHLEERLTVRHSGS